MVGINVRKHRMAAGISQEELAARMNVDQGYVSKLEAGQRNPTIKTIGETAIALGIPAALLFSSPRK